MKKYVSLLFLFAVGTTMPMARVGQFAKKAFGKACTAAHWSIATLPTTLTAVSVYKIHQQKNSQETPASPIVQAFAREQCKAMGVQNSESIPVISVDSPIMPIAVLPFPTRIVLNEPWEKQLAQMLQRKEELDNPEFLTQHPEITPEARAQEQLAVQNSINAYTGSLQHEADHIRNNDLQKNLLVTPAIPFAVHAGYKGIQRVIQKPTLRPPTIAQAAMKIPTGIGKLLTSAVLISLYRKNFEQRADDAIQNKKEILESFRSDTKNIDDHIKQSIPEQWPAWKKKLVYNAHFVVHPTNAKRIQKLDSRIAALEKQEKETPPHA